MDIDYRELHNKAEQLLEKIKKIRPKELGEFDEEYQTYLEENYSLELKELEEVGKAFYQDSFIGTYFYNSKNALVGFRFYDSNGVIDKMSLTPLLLLIAFKI